MPMNCCALAHQMILDVDHHRVSLAHLNGRARHHSIHGQNTAWRAIRIDAMRPMAIRSVERALKAGLAHCLVPLDLEFRAKETEEKPIENEWEMRSSQK